MFTIFVLLFGCVLIQSSPLDSKVDHQSGHWSSSLFPSSSSSLYLPSLSSINKDKHVVHSRSVQDSTTNIDIDHFFSSISSDHSTSLRLNSGSDLKICRKEKSYCTASIETELSKRSEMDFDSMLREPMREIHNQLDLFGQQFDEIFRELLESSKMGFHNMFMRTYGLLYEKHSSMFTEMFNVLERYYTSGTSNLESEFHRFFTTLYKKMFQELNAQYTFNEDYLTCIGDYMDSLKPFGDIPKKLIIEVKRSFIATRTFHQALLSAKEIIKNVMEVSPKPNCYKMVTQMKYCQLCKGLKDVPPCKDYCENVLTICTRNYGHMNKDWNQYIDHLLLMISRLETSFNIESVVGPIDIKISEAIMNFQENGQAVSKKLFQSCGKPRIGKRRAPRNSHRNPAAASSVDSTKSSDSSLELLLKDIKRKIKRNKDFWNKLPQAVCNKSTVTSTINNQDPNTRCWNQTEAGVSRLTDKSLAHSKQNAILNQQIHRLRQVNAKLDAAYKGLDVSTIDESYTDYLSGSGSGSGDGSDDDETGDDDEDNDNGDAHPSPETSSPSSTTPDIYFSSSGSTSGGEQPSVTIVVTTDSTLTRIQSAPGAAAKDSSPTSRPSSSLLMISLIIIVPIGLFKLKL